MKFSKKMNDIKINTIIIDLIKSYISNNHNDSIVRLVRECMHCGREFQSMKDDFCSFDCVKQSSS